MGVWHCFVGVSNGNISANREGVRGAVFASFRLKKRLSVGGGHIRKGLVRCAIAHVPVFWTDHAGWPPDWDRMPVSCNSSMIGKEVQELDGEE